MEKELAAHITVQGQHIGNTNVVNTNVNRSPQLPRSTQLLYFGAKPTEQVYE